MRNLCGGLQLDQRGDRLAVDRDDLVAAADAGGVSGAGDGLAEAELGEVRATRDELRHRVGTVTAECEDLEDRLAAAEALAAETAARTKESEASAQGISMLMAVVEKMEEDKKLKEEKKAYNLASGKNVDIVFEIMIEKNKFKEKILTPHTSSADMKVPNK